MKKIKNSLEYYASEDGRIFRNGRSIGTYTHNYPSVVIRYENGEYKTHYIHRLIAEAFIPNPDNKAYVNHKDGNRHNNHVSNLEWTTPSENTQHAVDIGLKRTGVLSPNSILNEEQVHEICRLLAEGRRVKDIKDMFGISQSIVSEIKAKKKYKAISSLYTFPEKKRLISDETALWICKMLSEGKRHKEINELYTGGNIPKGVIDTILHRLAYKDLSEGFDF